MKYYTINYDANYPMLNQINVPLNSVYGIGVRVKKNGAYIPLAKDEVLIGEQRGNSTIGDYVTVNMASGNSNGIIRKDVIIEKQPTILGELSDQRTQLNSSDEELTYSPEVVASNIEGLTLPATVKASDVDYTIKVTLSSETGITEADVPASQTGVLLSGTAVYYKNGDKWKLVDGDDEVESLDLSSTSYVKLVQYEIPAQTAISADFNFKVNSNDGYVLQFPLQISESDKGVFEREFIEKTDMFFGLKSENNYKIIVSDDQYDYWTETPEFAEISSHIGKASDYLLIMTSTGGQDNMDDNI